jgi:rod shape-determining protein MreD
MRWPAYFILAYVAIGLQIGLGEYLRVGGALPNLILLAVIFIAVNAPRDAALLGCFGIGAIQDLVGLHPLGLYALAYALVAMFVVSTQELVYRAHPITHFTLAFVGGILVAAVVCIHGWLQGPREAVGSLLATALYTAILAPFLLGGLHLTRKAFAFSTRRRVRAF